MKLTNKRANQWNNLVFCPSKLYYSRNYTTLSIQVMKCPINSLASQKLYLPARWREVYTLTCNFLLGKVITQLSKQWVEWWAKENFDSILQRRWSWHKACLLNTRSSMTQSRTQAWLFEAYEIHIQTLPDIATMSISGY